MTEQAPPTRTMKISDVKAKLSSLVNEVYRRETRVLVEKAGIPVAALVSIEDLKRLTRLDREWAAGTRALEEFSLAFQGVPIAELEERVAQIIAEGRAREEAELERQPA
jgi:prevent-host-death family protein